MREMQTLEHCSGLYVHFSEKGGAMRRKKLIALIPIIFILSLTVIFGNVEQDKRIRITNSSHRDNYALKNKIIKDKMFGSRDNQPQYVPGEIIVKFEMPLSDFEIAYIFGEYLPQIIGGERTYSNHYRVKIPENCSVEKMVQVLEQNPFVEYAELNGFGHITERANEFGNYIPERPLRVHNKSQFLEAPESDDMQHKDIHIETNMVATAYNAGQEAIKKYNGIPSYSEADNNKRKIQPSDKQPVIRSKAKIYKFRDSEGRLVITNLLFLQKQHQ